MVQEEQSFDSSDVRTGTQTTWLHVDHLNIPRIGTDDSQAIVWNWGGDSFAVGEPDTDADNGTNQHDTVDAQGSSTTAPAAGPGSGCTRYLVGKQGPGH